MSTKLILYLLKNGAYYTYNLLILFFIGVVINDVYSIIYKGNKFTEIRHVFTNDFGKNRDKKIENKFIFSKDKKVEYQSLNDSFKVEVKLKSIIGIYNVFYELVSIFISIWIFWSFYKIFKVIDFQSPFKLEIVKRIKWLGIIFLISSFLALVNLITLNYLLKYSEAPIRLMNFEHIVNNVIAGLVIIVIAVVYQRGVEIYEENILTV